MIAYHESGHAIVGHALPNADPIHKVSVISRGRALGWTLSRPVEDKFLVTRSEMIDELAMLLGGRVAEELWFLDPTTGASNDIEKATQVARKMVCEYGMSDGLCSPSSAPAENFFWSATFGHHMTTPAVASRSTGMRRSSRGPRRGQQILHLPRVAARHGRGADGEGDHRQG